MTQAVEMVTITKQEYDEYQVLKGLVSSLIARVEELESQLRKNSKNSNKPPSSDGPRKSTVKNSRKPSGKTSGGQQGHEGATRGLTPKPDTVIELPPKTQCECGGNIILATDTYTVRQVTDIAPVTVVTVEYRAQEGICGDCGKVHKAGFPQGIESTVSYGNNLQAIVTYLTTYQLIPLKRATELVEDLLGLKVSQGMIVSSGQEAYEKLMDTEARIKTEIQASDVVHFDETGMRVSGKTHWLHSAGTQDCTLYTIHEKRGTAAMDVMGILPVFKGTAVHDHWKSYYHYDKCSHAECNEHHLRSLKYLYEALSEQWAGEMACLLLRIKRHVDLSKLFGSDHLEQTDIEAYERFYRDILSRAAVNSAQAPKESQRMIKRLTAYEQETLLFMLDFDVPFTNNLAERDVRMPKAKQKISGCFRSDDGAKAFARIRGFLSTVKKRGKGAYDGLVSVFNGDAKMFLFPDTP